MSSEAIAPRVVADFLPAVRGRDIALVVAGAALTGAAAQLSIPLPGTPVPLTGQTFAVLLAGAALGAPRALAAMTVYVGAGLAGVPWFAEHSHGYVGATFGYLIGFAVASAVVGALCARGGDRRILRAVVTMLIGNLFIYSVGVPWLAASVHVSLAQAWHLGARPFLAGDALKIALVAVALPTTWRLLRTTDPGRK